jgi:serine/threonine protein kinase/tetratricopeptide (TPR) repeat protein
MIHSKLEEQTATGVCSNASLKGLRDRWRGGRKLCLEDYLAELGNPTLDREELLDLIHEEVLLREERGEKVAVEEYIGRFPQQADGLRTWFEVHEAFQSSKPVSLVLSTVSFESPEPAGASDHARVGSGTEHAATIALAASSRSAQDDAGPPAAVDPTWPRLNGYDILGELGKGGMGKVFRAYDRKHRRLVALKTMNRVSASALYRFKQEFRSLLGVAHRNLITFYELIGDGQAWFLTMELIDGVGFHEGLRQLFPDGRSTERYAVLRAALHQLAEGVMALHAAGKLHRDIKPSNVLISRDGRVVLLDFGLVADQDAEGKHLSTVAGLVGTVAYMSPEQAAELPVSEASDWYSVGVMLYEALTGQLPFSGSMARILSDKQQVEPPPPREVDPDVPEALSALCVDLLRRNPADRPSGHEILGLLGEAQPADGSCSRSGGPTQEIADSLTIRTHVCDLIGRQRHRRVLDDAYAAMVRGQTVGVYLRGTSGSGKTALLQCFLDQRIDRGDAVVLSGRCYESESVPYKAMDSLIDALGRWLGRTSNTEVDAILPRDVGSLARVFPVLRRVEAIAVAPRRDLGTPDPLELRRRAFSALRELLGRLGDRHPLVLAIDDLQWGDLDSAVLLSELLRPPDAPRLLFLGAFRSEDVESSTFLKEILRCKAPCPDEPPAFAASDLLLEPLSSEEARELVLALLGEFDGRFSTPLERLIEAIVRESGGNPFYVSELVRSIQAERQFNGPSDPGGIGRDPRMDPGSRRVTIALDEVLWSRIQLLPREAQQVLEVVAVSGRPLRLVDLNRCVDLTQDERVAVALLKAGRFVRSTGRADSDEIETYHDRVRETVNSHLDRAAVRSHHLRLARALEAAGNADSEALGIHLVGAGEPETAIAHFGLAAREAAEALAFARAARLYRRAIELAESQGVPSRLYQSALGDALSNAGRGAEAATAYLAAVAGSTLAEGLELQRRAAMQYLISGHIDEGLETLRTVLRAVGMSLPSTPRLALISLLWHRARLSLRGLGFSQRDQSEIAPSDLMRIDVCWSAGAGLSVVDTIRGADFQSRGLLLSLHTGEPSRVARALAMEAAHVSSLGGPSRRKTDRLLARAEELARQVEARNQQEARVEQPYAMGMVMLARGVSAYLQGRWRAAVTDCDLAHETFRHRCTGVAWELDTSSSFGLWGLSHLGEIAELARRWPIFLEEARERGDLYATVNLNSYLMSVVRLAANQPDEARADLARNMARWSRRTYHVQHNDALWAGVQIELFVGDAEAALKLIEKSWLALRRSLLLRVQFVRTSMLFLRGRVALAAAYQARRAGSPSSSSRLRQAERDAARLTRERMPCPTASATMIRGGLAAYAGDRGRAQELLERAARMFHDCNMNLCAMAVRRRLGELRGGEEGQGLVSQADGWMTGQTVQNPPAMTALFLPELR